MKDIDVVPEVVFFVLVHIAVVCLLSRMPSSVLYTTTHLFERKNMNMEKQSPEFIRPKTTYGDTLRFTAHAYAKLLWMRDRGDTEVAGYCVTGTEDPLLVTDFCLVKQKCTCASFDLDPDDGADFVDKMSDAGFMPWQFQRILAHSHPGTSASPSSTDEKNFKNAFTAPDWAIMLIIAEGGEIYCRLKFNVGPGGTKNLKVSVDFSQEFKGSEHELWEREYQEKVSRAKTTFHMTGKESVSVNSFWLNKEFEAIVSNDNKDDFPAMPIEDDELEDLDCHWSFDGNVEYWDDQTGEWYLYDPIGKKWFVLDDNDDKATEVDMSKNKAAALVVKWADKYAHEWVSAMDSD